MRRIRRSAVPASLLAGVLLLGAAACSDGGDDAGTVGEDTGGTADTAPADTATTEPAATETDPLTDPTGTETEATG
jgi:hypothetical protein